MNEYGELRLYARIDNGASIITHKLPLIMALTRPATKNRANADPDWEGQRLLVLNNMGNAKMDPRSLVFRVYRNLSCFDLALCGGMFTEDFLHYTDLDHEDQFGDPKFFNRLHAVLTDGVFREWLDLKGIEEEPAAWMKKDQQLLQAIGKLVNTMKFNYFQLIHLASLMTIILMKIVHLSWRTQTQGMQLQSLIQWN